MLETRGYAVKKARDDQEGRLVLTSSGVKLLLSSCVGVILRSEDDGAATACHLSRE